MIFDSTFTHFVRRIRIAALLLGAGVGCMAAACGSRPVTKDFNGLSTATRIEVHTTGFRPLLVVTDPGRIKAASDIIKQYEKGWKRTRLQGSAIPQRRFDFWDGDRYLGEFGINPDSLTTDNYYQEAPAEEIAKIAALFELKWPPK